MDENPKTVSKSGWDVIKTNPHILQTGDVIHVQGSGILSFFIRKFSRRLLEPKSWASHSAMVFEVTDSIDIIEATSKVGERPLNVYEGEKSKLVIARKPGGLSDEEKQSFRDKSKYYEGKKYGFFKLVYHLLDYFLGGVYFFRAILSDNKYPICSWIVAYVYDRVLNQQFGIPPNAAQPDDISDFCVENNWEFIWADSEESMNDFNKSYHIRAAKK